MDEQVKLALSIGLGITVQKTSAGYTATVDAVTATVAPSIVPAGGVPSPTTTTQVEDTANVSPTTVQPPLGTNPTTTQVEDTANVSPTTGTSTALTPTTPMVAANVAVNLITSTAITTPPSFPPAVGNQVISSREQAESPKKKLKTEGTYTGTRDTGEPTEAGSSRVTTHGNEDTYMTDSSKNSPLKRKEPELTLKDVGG